MCGVAGFVNLDGAPADTRAIGAMTSLLAHRGPDDRGEHLFSLRGGGAADSAFGFHRLSVLDLSGHGHQPMINPPGNIVLVYNGEVYNAFDYKAELEAAGVQFRSRTDSEIILHLYERHGIEGMLERLNGMFAMAIADLRSHQVHLARDHFGIKPLYWTQAGQIVMFASEAKAFLAHPAFAARIDEDYVDEQLAFRYVAGEGSLLHGVRQLRPGHRITITPEGVASARYWSIPDAAPASIDRVEAADRLDALMGASVRSQMISDVPIGSQLSGGIDSSLVTVLANAGGAVADGYSITFDDPKFSEAPWITEAASAAGVTAHTFLFTEESFLGPLQRAAWHMDQPISHPNALGIWQLAEQAKANATVLLSGEGADEVFAGYSRFRNAHKLSPESFIQTTQFQPAAKLARLRPEADVSAAIARRLEIFSEGRGDPLSNCVQYEMQTFLVDLLIRQDKMTMANGVENRVPFLDRTIVEFARTLSAPHLIDPPKAIVKDVARRYFSSAFVNRPKAAFNLPLSQYFRGARFTALMEDQLLPGMRQRGLVSEDAVRALWKRSLSAPALTEVFWIPVALELWAQQFVDRRPA